MGLLCRLLLRRSLPRGCTATSEPLLGRPGNNPYCHHRALELAKQGLRERIELVESAPDYEFAAGAFRLVLESSNAELAREQGPLRIDQPRSSRLTHEMGSGVPRPSP